MYERNSLGLSDLSDLYARHSRMVLGYLRGQRAADPEDLMSEVFIGVFRGLDTFVGDDDAFRSWVLVIAHRRLLDERRRLGRRPSSAVEPKRLNELVDAHERGDVEEEALERLATTRVLQALDALTDDQRTVVLLHTVGGLGLPQIAAMLGKRLGAVKSLHHRGLAAAARSIGSPAEWAKSGVGP